MFDGHDLPLRSAEDFVNASLYFESRTFLHGLLVVEDKLSMAHSLETRVPFLDNDLVDFALRVPPRYKLLDLEQAPAVDEDEVGKTLRYRSQPTADGKRVLREAVKPLLPDYVWDRPKQGFSAPDASLVPRREHRLREPAVARSQGARRSSSSIRPTSAGCSTSIAPAGSTIAC